jgi:Domain of unknown function (DUF3291)
MSVWDSLETLHQYVYRSDHVGPLRSRREWFEPLGGPTLVLWWILAGHIPTIEEAKERLRILKERGPCPEAFTFRQPFASPGTVARRFPEVDAEFCGVEFGVGVKAPM